MSNNEIPIEYLTHLARQGFVLEERAGQGASGSVFLASQPRLNRKVAVKFFDSPFLLNDAPMQKRFSREARILARFQHQSIPFVITEGAVKSNEGAIPYFVMEFIHGQTLRERLNQDHKLDLHTALEYSSQILDALAYAHSQNVVHRDIKPGNIMIDQRGRCFLIDFSIGVSLKPTQGLTRATAVGEQLGTTAYMSPEQISDSSTVDARTDIFSMGVVLVEMITGRTDRTNIARSLGSVPRNVVAAIEVACAHDASERMRTADELQRNLRGSFTLNVPSALPALAICANLKCPDADWTGNGYYRGPNIHEASTDSFCTGCGHQLKYQCSNCGAPFKNTPHCGACGTEMFRRPECKACGSWLTKEYMDDEGENGCRKCKAKIMPNPAGLPLSRKSVTSFADINDDIPF